MVDKQFSYDEMSAERLSASISLVVDSALESLRLRGYRFNEDVIEVKFDDEKYVCAIFVSKKLAYSILLNGENDRVRAIGEWHDGFPPPKS